MKRQNEAVLDRPGYLERNPSIVAGPGSYVLVGILVLAGFSICPLKAQDQPLVSLISPTANNTYNASTLQVEAQFGAGADPTTFTAEVNGIDITNLFNGSGGCGASGLCNVQATVPDVDLLNGTNIVSVDVSGPGDSSGVARVKFQFAPPNASTNPVAKLVPSISIQSVKLPQGADQNNVNSYQIVVGPGPGVAQTIYTTAGLTCSAGINSAQVLVLTRQTLVPDTSVTGRTGQACFGDPNSLATFLQGLPKGDLVIVNTFLGLMRNINTTSIGGTDFSSSAVTPNYYNAIGVAGASPRTVYESYQPNLNHLQRLGRDYLPPLTGSLMLDTMHNYYFVPSFYPELMVVPGTPSNNYCASISYNGGHAETVCPSSGVRGGFWIIAIDRLLGGVTDSYQLWTNSTNASQAQAQINDFAYLLNYYYKANDLLIITTFGTPIGSSAPVTPALYFSIARLGGNGYRLPQLSTGTSTYTLITSPDPEYQAAHYSEQSTSLNGGTGQIHGILSRDRLNRLVLNTGASDAGMTFPIGYQWSSVAFQQPQDWPAWTTGQQNAYLDLTSTANHYPNVRAILGCPAPNVCQPIRSYYDIGIGSFGTKPGILSFSYDSLAYVSNSSYAEPDFKAVIDQLKIEQGYENNVYSLYALFTPLTTSTTANFEQQLQSVAQNIDSSVQGGSAATTTLYASRLSDAAAVTSLFSLLPSIGPAFGAVSTVLGATAYFVPSLVGGVPDAARYGYTLGELKANTARANQSLLNGMITLFTSMVDDWGKLQIIGAGYGSQQSPWFMCTGCSGANVPSTSLEAFALGAKRRFYLSLVPIIYDADSFVEQPQTNPGKIAGSVTGYGGIFCISAYANAPAASYWSYPSISKPSTWDISIITQIATSNEPLGGRFKILYFPSSGLLTDLFTVPSITGTPPFYTISGGAGLTQDQFIASGGYLIPRAGYVPGRYPPSCAK
jgi:hypothetical protein